MLAINEKQEARKLINGMMDDSPEQSTELQFDRVTDIVRIMDTIHERPIHYKKLISNIHEYVIRKWNSEHIFILDYTGVMVYLMRSKKEESEQYTILAVEIHDYKNHITHSNEVDHETVESDLLSYASFMGIYFSCTHLSNCKSQGYNIKLVIILQNDPELTLSEIFCIFRNSNILAIRFICDDLCMDLNEFKSIIDQLPIRCEYCWSHWEEE